jgi:hypothetical protein
MIEMRSLSTLAYTIKCKWGSEVGRKIRINLIVGPISLA